MELYKYLKNLWENNYTDDYKIDEFMYKWLVENLCGNKVYTETIEKKTIGNHVREFRVNPFTETVEILILDSNEYEDY